MYAIIKLEKSWRKKKQIWNFLNFTPKDDCLNTHSGKMKDFWRHKEVLCNGTNVWWSSWRTWLIKHITEAAAWQEECLSPQRDVNYPARTNEKVYGQWRHGANHVHFFPTANSTNQGLGYLFFRGRGYSC